MTKSEKQHKTPRTRLTEITTLGAFNRKHRNPIEGEKKQHYGKHTKKSPTQAKGISDTNQTPETSNSEIDY